MARVNPNVVVGVLIGAVLIYVLVKAFTDEPKKRMIMINNADTRVFNDTNNSTPMRVSNVQPMIDMQDTSVTKTPSVGYRYIDNQVEQYDKYYVSNHNPLHIDADTCLVIPQMSVNCINQRLMKNGNNIGEAINACGVKNKGAVGCMGNMNGYYYPTDRPYVPNIEDPMTRKAYVIRTSLNAPMEKTVMVKLNDSI
jgi:hypothetical protein